MNGARGLAAVLLSLAGGLLALVYAALMAALVLAPAPGLEVFAVVSGALALFTWFLGASLRRGGLRPFGLTPGRSLRWLMLVLGLGALVLSAGQPLLTGLLMPLPHVGAALLPALMAVGLALGKRGRLGGQEGEGIDRTHGTNETDGLLGTAEADAASGDGLLGDAPPHAVDLEPSPEPTPSHRPDASYVSYPPYPSYPSPSLAPTPPPSLAVTWQSVAAGIAWGGCAATLLALVVESLAVLGLIVLVVTLTGDSVAWGKLVERLTPEAGTVPDPALQMELMKDLLAQPLVVVAAFLLMGALAPFTEELAKLLGPLLIQRRDAAPVDVAEGRRRAWRRGVCAGAGFGAFEAIFYGGMVFSPLPWVAAVALRACTTVMHAVFGGAAALGWRLGTGERRMRAGLGLVAVAVLGHGLWNSLALGAMVASLQAGGSGEGQPVGALGSILALGLILLFYGLVAVFAALTRWVDAAGRTV